MHQAQLCSAAALSHTGGYPGAEPSALSVGSGVRGYLGAGKKSVVMSILIKEAIGFLLASILVAPATLLASTLTISGQTRPINVYNSSGYACFNPVASGGAGSYVWDLPANPGGCFTIDSASGAVRPTAALAVGDHPVTVRVTDAAGAAVTLDAVIPVVDTGTVVISTDTIFDNYAGSNWFCTVGILASGFSNTNTGTSWTITDPTGYFGIAAGYNYLSLKKGTPPAGDYPITMSLVQNGNSLGPFLFTIHVLPAQRITSIAFAQNTVSTSQAAGVVVGSASTAVWESGYQWSIPASGSDGGTFTISDASKGVVTLARAPALGDRGVTIQVQDGLNTYSQTVTVHVVEGTVLPPSNLTLAVPTNLDNFTSSGTLGAPTVTGITGTPSWSVTGDGVGYRYAIDPATGTITIVGCLSYNPTIDGVDYSDVLKVTCTDGINTCTNSFRVPVAACVGPVLNVGPGQQFAHLNDAIQYIWNNCWIKSSSQWRNYAGVTFNVYPSDDPGYYLNDGQVGPVCGRFRGPVTIQGAPGQRFPRFHGGGIYYQKGFFMGYDYDIFIKNVEIYGVTNGANISSSCNLAAVVKESGCHTGNVILDNFYIHDCQDGIARGTTGCKWFVTNGRISHCGVGEPGQTHNIYVQGDLGYFKNVLTDQSSVGHTFKTRCNRTVIDNCRIYDGEHGHGSINIDFCEGGIDTLVNTIVQKGPNWQNAYSVHFASRDSHAGWPWHQLTASNCLFVADVWDPAQVWTLMNRSLPGTADGTPASASLADNRFFGYRPTNYAALSADSLTGAVGTNTVTNSTALLAQPPLDWSFPGPGPDPTIDSPPGPFLAPYGVYGGAQITIPVNEIRIDVNSPVGTSVVHPTWLPGNTGATSPTWSLRKNPGNRYAIDPTTGAINTTAPLLPGMVDVLEINVAQAGIQFRQVFGGQTYYDHPSDGSFIHSIYVVVSGNQLPTYTITASATAGGTISPSGTTLVTQGYSQTYAITANMGYSIADVTVDGASVGIVSSYTFSDVQANHTIAVAFAASYTITTSVGTGGTISPSGTVLVVPGGSQTFTITPGTGYVIGNVTVDGTSIGAVSTYTFNNVAANHTIAALFNSLQTTIAVFKAGPTITTGGMLDPTFGGVTGASVVQLAVDDTGIIANTAAKYTVFGSDAAESATSFSYYLYKFDLSSIPAGSMVSKAQLRLYETAGNGTPRLARIVTHDWTQATATLAGPNKPASPSLTWGPGSNAMFSLADIGTLANFESCPTGAAYAVKDVTSDVQAFVGGTVPNYGWAVAQGNRGFIFSEAGAPAYDPGQRPALFVSYVGAYTITASAGPGGTVSPSGAVRITAGNSQAFTVSADSGHVISDVVVDGFSVGAVNTYTFAGVSSDHTIIATFKARPAGDINGDGQVDVVDLLHFVDAFGSVAGDGYYDPACDFNGDGSVDVIDLLTMVENFGT
jgi:hypothetical protein